MTNKDPSQEDNELETPVMKDSRGSGVERLKGFALRHRRGLIIFGLIFFYYSAYFGESISGRVIDAETGQPIADVIVVAQWILIRKQPNGIVRVGTLRMVETVTDKDGQYYFWPWGPRFAFTSHLASQDPRLLYYKDGYEITSTGNNFWDGESVWIIRSSDWDGKDIRLAKDTKNDGLRAATFWSSMRPIDNAVRDSNRYCQKIIELRKAIDIEVNRIVGRYDPTKKYDPTNPIGNVRGLKSIFSKCSTR